jgi:hypothetical protein
MEIYLFFVLVLHNPVILFHNWISWRGERAGIVEPLKVINSPIVLLDWIRVVKQINFSASCTLNLRGYMLVDSWIEFWQNIIRLLPAKRFLADFKNFFILFSLKRTSPWIKSTRVARLARLAWKCFHFR